MMTKQEILDKAVRGLRSQNWQPAYENGSCMYQTYSGLRCAWGHVGTTLTWENCKASNTRLFSDICDDGDFANDLQLAHDYSADAHLDPTRRRAEKYNYQYQDMENNFRKFAAFHGLTFPENQD